MLTITHAAIGGALGGLVSNPVIAFGLGVISHVIVDKVPHYWPKTIPAQLGQIIIDAFASVAMLIGLYLYTGDFYSPILWGAIGGVFVDFMLVMVFKIHSKLWNGRLRTWHEKRQPHKRDFVYLLTDIFQIMMSLLIISMMR